MPDGFSNIIQEIFTKLDEKGWMLTIAESCTGGLISAAITNESGSSVYFDRSFITYSNESKIDCLGVFPETVAEHGAVSQQTAHEMAKGALKNSKSHIALSVAGIAGPTGGSAEKPVGLVYIGHAVKGGASQAQSFNFPNLSREEVRHRTVEKALQILLAQLS